MCDRRPFLYHVPTERLHHLLESQRRDYSKFHEYGAYSLLCSFDGQENLQHNRYLLVDVCNNLAFNHTYPPQLEDSSDLECRCTSHPLGSLRPL